MKKILSVLLSLILLVSCSSTPEEKNSSSHFQISQSSGETLKIVAGSENKELEPIIEEYAKANKQNIEIDYLGSLDIMRLLSDPDIAYDAVWPASSIWLNMGDTNHILKYQETTSQSPVVFGIKKSLAEDLGFVGKDVTVKEIIDAINSGKLKFTMTSATQSNSGASAYLGFLNALAADKNGLTSEDLANEDLQNEITSLLAGVERSSGSSNWLTELFLSGDYDAMVNYEQLVIATNKALEEKGKEALYLVYPIDGLSISDSPLAYVDKNDSKKEEAFKKFQEYLLSDEAQSQIEKTGKRSAYGTVREENRDIYKKDWGIDLDKTVSPIRFPKAEVIMEALNMYQSEFKKPAFTIYVLDYSGSMGGNGGYEQMNEALEQVLIPENAKTNLLLGTSKDLTYILPFSDMVLGELMASGNGEELDSLYQELSENYRPETATFMYEAIDEAISILKNNKDELKYYSPAIVVLSDGMPNGPMDFDQLKESYQSLGYDVPIFSILFGDARKEDLEEIATMSKARVFDGRSDMIKAFQNVKGYN